MSKIITTESLEPGSILAEPVLNSLGQILINSGIELNERHINVLKTWNIQFVNIKFENGETDNELNVNLINKSRELLFGMINWKPRNLVEVEIIELGAIALAHKLKGELNDC
jgi:hypothetical protein